MVYHRPVPGVLPYTVMLLVNDHRCKGKDTERKGSRRRMTLLVRGRYLATVPDCPEAILGSLEFLLQLVDIALLFLIALLGHLFLTFLLLKLRFQLLCLQFRLVQSLLCIRLAVNSCIGLPFRLCMLFLRLFVLFGMGS